MWCFQPLVLALTTLVLVRFGCCQTCSNLDADVIIIGAGMSGIAAANRLQDGMINDILVFEAQPQVGGRVKSGEIGGVRVSLGATWIQGIDPAAPELHPLYQIAQRCGGLQGIYQDYDSQTDYDSQGGTNFTGEKSLRYDDYDTANEQLSELTNSLAPTGRCVDKTFRSGLNQSGWTPSTPEDKWVEWYSFDFCLGETPDNTSLCEAVRILDATYSNFLSPNTEEGGDYFVTDQEGYEKLIKCMAADLSEEQLHLNATVTEIDWSDNECVCVTANENGNQNRYCARHAISTLSVGVLQSNETVRFSPELPALKRQVFEKLSMARYINIYVEFSEVFWDSTEIVSHIHEDRGYYPLFINLNMIVPGNPKVLIAALTGDNAERAVRQQESDTIAEIEQVLRHIYPGRTVSVVNAIIPDWFTNPLFLGSFSHAPVGITSHDFNNLAAPIQNLYFSGEGIIEEYSGFIHGAYLAGRNTAQQIIQRVNNADINKISTTLISLSIFCALCCSIV